MYHVYVMASSTGVIYIGVTNDLRRRVAEHKEGLDEKCFTSRYSCRKLVYAELHQSIEAAIMREKQIKKWRREKKTALIASLNPNWIDMTDAIW